MACAFCAPLVDRWAGIGPKLAVADRAHVIARAATRAWAGAADLG